MIETELMPPTFAAQSSGKRSPAVLYNLDPSSLGTSGFCTAMNSQCLRSAMVPNPACTLQANGFSAQVVKAFVVLAAPFKSSNREKLTAELQDHVKNSTAPYKYPRKAGARYFCLCWI